MITFSTSKTGTLATISTSGASWTDVPCFRSDGTTVSATNAVGVERLYLVNGGSALGWARLNGGAPFILPAGPSAIFIPHNFKLTKLEIIRDGSTDLSGFSAFGV